MKREQGMGGAFRAASIDPRLMAGIDQIDAGFAIFDDQLRLLVCNAGYPQIRGYLRSTPCGETTDRATSIAK